MRKTLWIALILAAGAAGGYGYYEYTKKDPPPTISTAKIARGDIAETVGATGQLQAVTTVQVGTQVSGTVQELGADFNSLVRKGQVIARLDPSLFQTQIEQAKANLIRSQADTDRLRVSLDDARTKLQRAEELSKNKLIAQTDLEAAQVAVRSAEAQLKSQEAAVTQSQASLQQNQVNLEHTIITAPIDGLVISRNVDVGQTVAASMSAPTLFILAADLTKMQVIASLDESDVGRIRPGQLVQFRVDAYPNETFLGTVTQVRLQPTTVQNVVTYSTVIDVPNPDLKLKPGMTANVNIEIARKNDVLRVPNAALRFRPTAEIFEALGQTPPAGGGGGGGRGRGGRTPGGPQPTGSDSSTQPVQPAQPGQIARPPAAAATAAPRNQSAAATTTAGIQQPAAGAQAATSGQRSSRRRSGDQASGESAQGANAGVTSAAAANGDGSGGRDDGRGGGSGRGRGNFQERLAAMTPDERQKFLERMKERGLDPAAMTSGRGAGAGAGGGVAARGGASARQTQGTPASTPKSASPARPAGATTIDALFGPLPPTESFGQVWLSENGKLARVPLRLGITDGQQTEIIQGNVKEGQDVVTNVITAAQRASTNATSTAFPGFQQNRGGGFPGGGGFGGGRGGGGRGGR